MDAVVTNRMLTGTMGPELSFAAIEIQTDEATNRHGFVVRARRGHARARTSSSSRRSASTATASTRAWPTCRLLGGEVLTITAETVDGQLTPFDGYLCSEHLSIARCGDLVGMADNELTNNPRLGTADPPFLTHVDGGDGLSPAAAAMVAVTDRAPRPLRRASARPARAGRG